MKSPILLGLSLLLAGGAALAATPAIPPVPPVAAAAPMAPAAPVSPDEAAQRLDQARQRLDAAAREVAELSMQMGGGGPETRVFEFRSDDRRRAILGIQLGQGGGDDSKTGARVVAVSPGGPAEAAGLKSGDVIVGIQGVDLRGRDSAERELMQQMRGVEPDQKVKLKVLRAGKVQDFEVTARGAPHDRMMARGGMPGGMAMGMAQVMPGMPLGMDGEGMPGVVGALLGRPGMLGLELATLTPKLGQYFGVDKGVLVLKAPVANKLRIEEGDVILAIDGREPKSSAHAAGILRSYQQGEKVKLRVQRQRKSVTLDGEIAYQHRDFPDLHGAPMSPPPPGGMGPMPPPPGAAVPGSPAPHIQQRIVIRTSKDEEHT